jgi:hypothetical protein
MTQSIKNQLEQCIADLREGKLTEQQLRAVADTLDNANGKTNGKCQDLLYLQAGHTGLTARVNGMLIVQQGQVSDGPPNPEEWPYKTVLEAICDGWRVIQFPNLALLTDESRAYGLGCEFILER